MKLLIKVGFTPDQEQVINEVYTSTMQVLKDSYTEKSLHLLHEACTTIEVKANGRLRTSGGNATTLRIQKLGVINMNRRLFASTGTCEDFKNTFTHELAHILINFLKGSQQSHNYMWKNLFLLMGGNGERCHDMDVSHLRPRKLNRTTAHCSCDVFQLTKGQVNKIKRLSCKSCKEKLTISKWQ